MSTLRELLDKVQELDEAHDRASGVARALYDQLQQAKDELMAAMTVQGTTTAAKEGFKVKIEEKVRPKVLDWDAFYAYILATGNTQLLERRVSQKAYEELALQLGETLPGTDIYEYQTLKVQ